MRCKRHTADLSSSVGVCASCIRERLLPLVASAAAEDDHRRLRKPDPRPLLFPRSVSPYVAPRKSDAGEAWPSHLRFCATPQVGPIPSYGGASVTDTESARSFKKKGSGFSRLSNLFRTRSDDFGSGVEASVSDPRVSSRHSCDASTSASSSWFSTIISGRRKKQPAACYFEDVIAGGDRRPRRVFCRGMSPARDAESEDERETSGSVEESPVKSKMTPATGTPGRRKTRAGLGKTVSGMAFCLSPLVRPSPNRHWRQKGSLPPEFRYSGENTAPAKPHISAAASFCANRSRKLVDFGRAHHRR